MPNSQSNKQTTNVKVNVINKIDSKCCDDKKKRKPKKRQPPPPPPEVINEFPALATPSSRANTSIPSISPIAVRNVVYPAQTVQISPEGDAPPVPAYFEKHYTNLVRTIEDMRTSIVNEMRAKAQVLPDPMPPEAPERPMPVHPGYAEYQPENQPDFYVPNEDPFVLPSPPEQPAPETQRTPAKQLIKQFEGMSTSKASPPYGLRQREEPEPDDIPKDWLTSSAQYQTMSEEEILRRYKKYYPNTSYQGRTLKSLIDALIRNAKKRSSEIPV